MKKLNRKGFTLVELLAVIIILAIVVGVTIPAITNVINSSKNNALGIATESAYDYLRDQYDIFNLDSTSASSLIQSIITDEDGTVTITDAETDKLAELGFKASNVKQVTAKIKHNAATNTAEICVTVDQIKADGEYFVTDYWKFVTGSTDIAEPKTTTGIKNKAGNGCQ